MVLINNKKGQAIVLMGIILAVSVFVMSSLAAEINNLDIVISTERSISLLPEFNSIKESFILSLNYNLVENIVLEGNKMKFYGNISNITSAFNQTVDEYYVLGLQHDLLFEAELHNYWVAHPGGADNIYYINTTLSLENQDTRYTEEVLYSIICIPLI